VVAIACALCATASFATDADDYLRRAAQRDLAMFDALDRDHDGHLTVEEVRGNIDLEARFNDLDINRDGVITRGELTRYIALQYGVASGP
jgi:Ca2+-binding EF-hand superfamily protein